MRSNILKAAFVNSGLAVSILLCGTSYAQQVVNLAAGPATAALPDGSAVPMWGYTCGVAVATNPAPAASCTALNPAVQALNTTPPTGYTVGSAWSPVVITVPYVAAGTSLTINLTNNLSFTAATIPTSLTIVGQLGGGLGTPTSVASPTHIPGQVTWPIANTGATFNPPPQGPRVQSFATEVAAGATTALTWTNLLPGTYLIESGTHPSIQGPMGLYGVLVVTTAPTTTASGCAYPDPASATGACLTTASYNAEIPLLLSEIDPVQNAAVAKAVTLPGFSEATVWSGQPGGCGNPATVNSGNCYPPAVNYTPLYYLFNGLAFDKTNSSASLFPVSPSATTGTVLVRLVNAGLRMHVPSIVGAQTTTTYTAQPLGSSCPAATAGGFACTSNGFSLIAEDGNPAPGVPKVQSDVFMSAGKTYDVMINVPATAGTALPVYDRELSLSANATGRDAGMLAYIGGANGSVVAAAAGLGSASCATTSLSYSLLPNTPPPGYQIKVSDPAKGVIGLAKCTNVNGGQLAVPVAGLTFNPNGTFSYSGTGASSFSVCVNGAPTAGACSGLTIAVALNPAAQAGGISCGSTSYTSTISSYLAVKTPGVLANCTDSAKLPLTVTGASSSSGGIVFDANGGFTISGAASGAATVTFTVANSTGTTGSATANVTFPTPSNLQVVVVDGADKTTQIGDYRWVIEEDNNFYVDPSKVTNTGGTTATTVVPTLGVNFHTSYQPFVAQGCTGPKSCEGGQTVFDPASGAHINTVCDVGNGVCRPDSTGKGFTPMLPSAVHLDPTKRYYISVLPGDAADPFYAATDCATAADGSCIGHGMGGAPIGIDPYTHLQHGIPLANGGDGQTVQILTQPSPYPTAKLSVFVFEDDFPLNGENDGGGASSVNKNNEPGLGGFQIHLWDAFGGNGDFTGQMGFDMFNQPLSNSLAGTIDPLNGNDACPIVKTPLIDGNGATDPTATGITGFIVTCPEYESDGVTPSPIAGQAVIANLMPGRWGVIATPGADRIARGEEWLQTNTLDGQKAHDSFTRIGEPSYFQEYGPAGFHVSIGFANPAIINGRKAAVCAGQDPTVQVAGGLCNNTITGRVVGERLSRTPDERLYGSGSHDAYAWTQCYVSFGDPDGEDFAFTKCDADGNFTLTGLPDGDWRITTFDQWNDQLVDGLSTPVRLSAGASPKTTKVGDIATTQWQTNLLTRTFIDDNEDGRSQADETGIPFANVAVRLRDGSIENWLTTDFSGTTNFNETFPLFAWYTVETDVTRYKNTGSHVVYDAGGPADGSPSCGVTGYPACGTSTIGKYLANTAEKVSVPTNLRVPGAIYCADADCSAANMLTGAGQTASPTTCTVTAGTATCTSSGSLSTGRIDPPWVGIEGWQGFPGQSNFIEFGKAPYSPGENGGIKGHVVYASTRPFDDPQLLVQTQWEGLIPNVTINLYQEGVAADGVTPTLTLVDTTKTSSFDDYAQGFRADGVTPNMSCPGQGGATGPNADLFFFSLANQPNYLNVYNAQHVTPDTINTAATGTPLPFNSQFKCYDGMHNWNQIQPAPYDGVYKFPSVTAVDPNGKPTPTGTNCTICKPDPATDLYANIPMLPAGKYVVEVVLPPGYELVKEEDKNILIGDNYIAPATQQFGGLGNVFILPDQASLAAQAYPGPGYNANNAQQPTQSLGTTPSNNIVPGFIPEPTWPCVGQARIVPDYISLFPQSGEVAPFAGATRNLCDRKEVTLNDQTAPIAKFYLYTSTHIAARFTGGITDDYTSEFDPFSPTFGEKFSPPDLPVSLKDWSGAEISRVYADHWGSYDGMTYSTWEVNPPNPTGYAPTMMVVCMNDPGPIVDTRPTIVNNLGATVPNPTHNQMITDPLFTPGYSQFCYELPFMPRTAQYLDTPVVPTSAFAGAGYNNVDCAYPDSTPAVKEVDGDGLGPWVSGPNKTLTIYALGDQMVPNNAYVGPQATTAPYNQKTVNRHYGFGNTAGSVTIGGVAATPSSWSDSKIVVTVPSGVPACAVQQQSIYGGSAAQCGELVISNATVTTGTGTVSGVTVTNNGNGYTSRATATFAGGGATTNAAASNTATTGVFMGVARVTIPAAGIGRGYTSVPQVTFSASPAGAAATATGTAVLGTGTTAGRVVGVTITSAGSGYTARPTVTFAAPSCTPNGTTCATATLANSGSAGAFMDVVSVVLSNTGAGYTSNPTVTVSNVPCNANGTTCVRATATAAASPRQTFAGRQSVDTVTVTIGGKAPTHVAATGTIQSAIDAAAPGDLIIVDPAFTPIATATAGASCAGVVAPTTTCVETAANHNELLLMWKPVRLQGVGAVSSIINATTHPSGAYKLDAWRQQVNCLFGLGLNGSPVSSKPVGTQPANPYDPTGTVSCGSTNGTAWAYFTPYDEATNFNPQVDRLPLEAVVGWDINLNGNLAELLQEPSLMGALEGAGITVLGKGVNFPSNPYDPTLLAGFPTGTTLLQPTMSNPVAPCLDSTGKNPFPSNYSCNPSSIDALTITQGSQGGGGIFVHGWGHNLQIANNRIYSNAGTLSGGINIGQGEYPPSYVQGSATNAAPGSCEESPVPGTVLPYCHDVNVNVHNNYVALDSSTGDELFSATPAGAGGVSFCTGSDYYKFNYNWVCGNLSSGDGGGFGHLGYSYNGDIEHNTVIFNQSTNPTIPANGGGMVIMGTPDADVICGNNTNVDTDCTPVGFSIASVAVTHGGTGYLAGDTVNFAGGGGLSATGTVTVNGSGAITAVHVTNGGAGYTAPVSVTITSSTGSGFTGLATLGTATTVQTGVGPSDGVGPGLVINANLIMGNAAESGSGAGIAFQHVNGSDMVAFPTDPGQWNQVTVTNNIIVDNVGGWDGAGISLLDSPNVNIVNNTIAFNASTASSGILFNTMGAPLASQQGTSCTNSSTTTCPQIAGVAAIQHSAILTANLASETVCPPGHFQSAGANGATNGSCTKVSYPKLENNIIYHNSSYYIGVGALSPAFQQNVVSLLNGFTGTAAASQATTGACATNASYWDVGVRGDTGPGNHASTVTLTASDSVLSPGFSALGGGNSTASPSFVTQYCTGSRIPPEYHGSCPAGNICNGYNVPPGISDATVPNPIFNLTPAATVDEGNNWVNITFGPLSLTNPTAAGGANGNYGGGLPLGNYGITSGSSAAGRVTGANFADAPEYDFFNQPRKSPGGGGGSTDAGAVKLTGTSGREFTLSPALVDFGFVPHNSPTTVDQDVIVTNSGSAPLTGISTSFNCAGVTSCNLPSFGLQPQYDSCSNATLGAGQSCVITVVFNPTSSSQAARNANLVVTANGVSQTVALTGHDTIATVTTSAITPALTANPANTAAVTGTITITNTANLCLAAPCPGGSSVDAGPVVPATITLTQLTGTGTFALGGTCAVGTAINPGVPAQGGGSAIPNGTCTITVTYTPPATGALAGSARLNVTGYGTANAGLIVNRVINAN